MGQMLSILITGTGICSSILADQGISIPTTQGALNYIFLSVYCCLRRRGGLTKLKTPWWIYLMLAVVDVEANYLVVRAFRDTSITSVALLDCFAIPCTMILSFMVMKTR